MKHNISNKNLREENICFTNMIEIGNKWELELNDYDFN
jgi:hypothetical protein